LRGKGSPALLDYYANAASMLALGRVGGPVAKISGSMAGLWASLQAISDALFAGEAPIKKSFGEDKEIWCLRGPLRGEAEGLSEEGVYLIEARGETADVPCHCQQWGLGGAGRLGNGARVEQRSSVAGEKKEEALEDGG